MNPWQNPTIGPKVGIICISLGFSYTSTRSFWQCANALGVLASWQPRGGEASRVKGLGFRIRV